MGEDDLIRRGDVQKVIAEEGLHILDKAIAALPAVAALGVRVKDAPEQWYFDAPYSASFNGSGDDTWLGLKAHGMLVASYSVKEWGSEQACVEAAWRHAYEPAALDTPAPALMAELVEALAPLYDIAKDRAADVPEWKDSDTVLAYLSIGSLRRAVAVLAKIGGA